MNELNSAIGPLFAQEEPVQKKGCWLQGRRFSVSKLAIALSDFSVFMWASLLGWELLRIYSFTSSLGKFGHYAPAAYAGISVVFAGSLLKFGRSTPRRIKRA